MAISGIVNTRFIVAYMIAQHGTEEQTRRLLLLLVLVLEREPELGTEGDLAILADLQVLLDHFGDAQVPQRLTCGVYGG
jgi:hypothetical protein